MQVSIKWLKDYIDFDWSAEELADRFTMAGVPVENVIRADEGLDHVVTGRIEVYSPYVDFMLAKKRQFIVLDAMTAAGYLRESVADDAKIKPIYLAH